MRRYQLDWIKIDYNIDVGDRFDPARNEQSGRRLHDHVAGYYAWLDAIRAAHPDLLVENCASGGLRFDLGIMAHAHTTWLSDVVDPIASVALGYGCTVQLRLKSATTGWSATRTAVWSTRPGRRGGGTSCCASR